ncbi:DUF5320 domain-containing protein [Clostridium sp.]|jgi:hypothetical protein|uniref:DUF5320 domain-containing protein n=1 Tax=Clostridium sp. TaxID=1506 RepID=UPI003A5C01A6
MPRRDGTGPIGMGPRRGRGLGLGFCNTFKTTNEKDLLSKEKEILENKLNIINNKLKNL